jgi:multidrug resistance efflux pump
MVLPGHSGLGIQYALSLRMRCPGFTKTAGNLPPLRSRRTLLPYDKEKELNVTAPREPKVVTRKTVLILGVLLAAVAAALGFFWPFSGRGEYLRLPGIVEIQEVRLGSKVGGRVEKIAVKEGQLVEPGDPLVYFEVPELRAQREQIQAKLQQALADWDKAKNGPREEEKEAAKAAMAAAKAKLDRLEAGWREEEKRQARNDLETAEADVKQAVDEYERISNLYRTRTASRAEYEAALAARDRGRGRANAARAHYDMLMAGSRKEDIAEARGEWHNAKAKYDELMAGTRYEDKLAAEARVGEMRGKLQEIDVNLAEAVVKAPDKAVVDVVAVRKGDLVPPNQPVIRVLRADDLWVKVYVPETDLGKIRLNQEVEVTTDAYPDKRFKGVVTHIAPISEFTPRNVQSVDERRHQVFGAKIHIPDPQGSFKSGMAAQVILPLH